MMTVLKLVTEQEAERPESAARAVRVEYGLSVLEAAKALGISASAVEEMEQRSGDRLSPEALRRKYELFLGTGSVEGRNLIFGHYPLRMAREILGLSVREIASEFGYSANSWRKIEGHARPLPRIILKNIEHRVRDTFTSVCGLR